MSAWGPHFRRPENLFFFPVSLSFLETAANSPRYHTPFSFLVVEEEGGRVGGGG